VLRRIWPALPVGATYALVIVLLFDVASRHVGGAAFTLAQMIIIFAVNTCLMYTARLSIFSFIPGMFFGFASFFATFFGGFGPSPHDPRAAWIATVLMIALGPAFAWLTARFGAHH
jgi:membrane protein insertase Oxa1/YidC/SpoIIIJ